MKPKREIRSLTGIRGVAAVYVVFFHYWIGVGGKNAALVFLAHGFLSVDLFFVLSGFVMMMTYGHMFARGWTFSASKVFLLRRIARVYPLYLVATLVGLVFAWLGWEEHPAAGHFVRDSVCNLLMIQALMPVDIPSLDAPAWSVSAELAAYLLFPLIAAVQKRKAMAVGLALLSCAVLAQLYSHPFVGLAPLRRCLPEFSLGVLAYRI